MLIKIVAYLPGILSLIILALFVYLGNPKNRSNIIFSLFNATAALWLISQFLYDISETYNLTLLAFRFSLFFGQLLPLALLLFSLDFPYRVKLPNGLLYIFSALYIGFSFLSFSSLNVSSVEKLEFGVRPTNIGVLYNISDYITVLILAISVAILIAKFRVTQDKSHHDQIKAILAGVLITAIANIISGIFLLNIYSVDSVALFIGSLSVVLFSIIASRTIIQHKLFSFRALLARSVVYSMSTISLLVMYSFVSLLIVNKYIAQSLSDQAKQYAYLIVIIAVTLSFPRINKLFNTITSKLFFRDDYDAQILLSSLNQTLVTNIELKSLLSKTAELLESNLKSSVCGFYIRKTSYFESRVVGSYKKDIKSTEIDRIQEIASTLNKKVHSTEVETLEADKIELNQLLRKNDVEVLVRLVSTLDYEANGIGYIFLGPKRSGNLYTNQDLKVLEIIANELVIAIENVLRYEEIEEFNVTLQKKIDDATKELQASNDKLKALDEAKDEFVSMASHQLRTPLTSIKGYISMVMDGDAGKINKTQQQMLGQAMFSSQRMVYLISDLLNVSRLKTGKFIIETKPVYLPTLVESELAQLEEGFATKQIQLVFKKPKTFPTIELDDMKIRQVIMNFVDNALYYTPNGGKITVELLDNKKSIDFRVKDTGIGVPKAAQHKMFTKFYRADNARKARPDGTGLGLFMAKKVIIAQGGSIIFDSKEGKGSTFGFSFPKTRGMKS